MTTSESPYFLGAFPEHPHAPADSAIRDVGTPLWDGEQNFRIHGEWQPGELRAVGTPIGKVAVIGHCVASDAQLHNEAAVAVRDDDPARLTHLPGSFTTIVVQPGKATVLTDLAGRNPVYHAVHDDNIIVSSRSGILAEKKGSVVDPLNMAARIGCAFVPELTRSQSFWQDVATLEGGQRLEVGQNGSMVDTYDRLIPDPSATYEDAVTALRIALSTAIENRMEQRANWRSDISGGFDSSSAAFLALRYLPEDKDLHSFVFHNSAPGMSAGDLEHAQRLAAISRRLVLHEIDTTGQLPYKNIDQLPFRDEPDPGALMPGGRDLAYFRAIQASGGNNHLTGGGGDGILTPDPCYLADALRAGKLRQFLRDGLALARLHDTSPLEVWSRSSELVAIGMRAALRRFADGIENLDARTPDTLWGTSDWLALGWLTPAARNQLAELAREKASSLIIPDGMDIGNYGGIEMLRYDARSYNRSNERARDFGIAFHTPYLDNATLRSVTNVAAWRRANPREYKRLLADALLGLVPAEIFKRHTKGDYGADLYEGIRGALPQLKQLFANSVLADLGIIDPKRVLQTLERISTEKFSIVALNHLVATELWLRHLTNAQLPPSLYQNTPQLPTREPESPNQDADTSLDLHSFHYVMPRSVYAAAAKDGSLIFLQGQKQQYRTTTPTAGVFLQTLNVQGGDVGAMLESLRNTYPDIDPVQIEKDAKRCIRDALSEGLIVSSNIAATATITVQGANSVHTPSAEFLAAWDGDEVSLDLLELTMTIGSFAAAMALRHVPPSWTVRLLKVVDRTWATDNATEEEAYKALAAAHRVTRLYVGRVACLEESLTSKLYLAARRRKASWNVGAAFDHARAHAHLAIAGKPIGIGKQLEYVTFLSTDM